MRTGIARLYPMLGLIFTAIIVFTLAPGRKSEAQNARSSEWEILRTLSPLPPRPPRDTTNAFADDPRAAALGQRLFFEKAIAGPITVGDDGRNGGLGAVGETGKISCASCHQPKTGWMIDHRSNDGVPENPHATALGAAWTTRNPSSIVNTAFYRWHENDGLADSTWADSLTDPEDTHSQNGSRLQVAHVLFRKYRAEYDAIFAAHGGPLDPRLDPTHPRAADFPATGKPGDPQWEAMAAADRQIVNHIFANFGKAMQAYLRRCISRNAPFDRWIAGRQNAVSASAKRGARLFVGKAHCVECHSGPFFTDDRFHTIGMAVDARLSPHADPAETGRYATIPLVLEGKPGTTGEFNVNSEHSDDRSTGFLDGLVQTEADKGRWRTKSLRQTAATAPYMHDGQLPTLRAVIDFYDRGGDPPGAFIGTKDPLIRPLHLTDREKNDLIAFLKTLTGEPLPARLVRDTSAP